MENIKLTIYDWMGYFIPGSLLLWAMSELFKITDITFANLYFNELHISIQSVLLIVFAYTLGHLLHGIANFSIDNLPSGSYPPENYFPDIYKKDFDTNTQDSINNKISKTFDLNYSEEEDKLRNIKNSYWLCYNYVIGKNSNSLCQLFLSISGFYRGLTIGSFVISLIYFIFYFFYCMLVLLIIAVVSLLIAFIFLHRIKRFKIYLTKTVYSDFLIS